MTAKKRLESLKQVRDDKYAILRLRTDEATAINTRRRREREVLHEVRNMFEIVATRQAKEAARANVAKQQAKVDEVEEQYADAVDLRRIASDEWNAAARLYRAAEEHAHAEGLVPPEPGAVAGMGMIATDDASAASLLAGGN